MIYLNPPYFLINGVSVFPDDSDPLQFYYLPMMPHLTMVTDSVSGASTPQIQLIEYEGAAGTGGFLNFDVNIGLDPDALNEVQSQLQRQLNLTGQPRMSPVTFVDGSVRLILLGAQSPDPPATGQGSSSSTSTTAATNATAAATAPQFVVKVQNAAKPALYGDNQATFSVQLDQYGATILHQALKGEMAPIAVVYSLQFLGLRPAFHVHLSIDWNRVQTYVDDHCSGGFLFFSSDIEKIVEKLIEDQVINIQVDTFTTDTDLGASGTSDRDRAVAECYELIKSNFFESSLPPPTAGQPDDWSKATNTFSNIADICFSGGASSAMASFTHKHTDLTRIDKKSLNFDVTERTAVLRTIYPQGHLNGLLDEIQQKGIDLNQFIVDVDLDNPFFQRRKVDVISRADFAGDQIGSIDVNLNYNGNVKSASVTGNTSQVTVDWSSVLVNNQIERPVSYTYTVNFKGVDTTQRPGQLTSSPYTVTGDVLDIEPRNELYGITVVPIRAFGFPWDRYPSVQVECRYSDPANNINLPASAVLNSQNTEVDWSLFLCDFTRRSFEYRLTFQLASGGTSITPWITTDDAMVNIVDPFPAKSALTILAALDWSQFQEALVFVAYPSVEKPVVQKSITLTKSMPTAPQFVVDRADPTQTLIYYEARLIRNNGQIWTIPGSVTSDAYLILQDGMKGHQIISIMPEQVDFSAKHIVQIQVQLRYVDPANSIDIDQSVAISAAGDVRSFAFDYLNPAVAPEYRADIQLDNGQTKSIDWTAISGNMLTIPLSQIG
jgi:hypothetical protein